MFDSSSPNPSALILHAPRATPLSRVGTVLAYLWLLRAPLFIVFLLNLLPVLGLLSFSKPIFENFFVLDKLPTVWASLATFMVTWAWC